MAEPRTHQQRMKDAAKLWELPTKAERPFMETLMVEVATPPAKSEDTTEALLAALGALEDRLDRIIEILTIR